MTIAQNIRISNKGMIFVAQDISEKSLLLKQAPQKKESQHLQSDYFLSGSNRYSGKQNRIFRIVSISLLSVGMLITTFDAKAVFSIQQENISSTSLHTEYSHENIPKKKPLYKKVIGEVKKWLRSSSKSNDEEVQGTRQPEISMEELNALYEQEYGESMDASISKGDGGLADTLKKSLTLREREKARRRAESVEEDIYSKPADSISIASSSSTEYEEPWQGPDIYIGQALKDTSTEVTREVIEVGGVKFNKDLLEKTIAINKENREEVESIGSIERNESEWEIPEAELNAEVQEQVETLKRRGLWKEPELVEMSETREADVRYEKVSAAEEARQTISRSKSIITENKARLEEKFASIAGVHVLQQQSPQDTSVPLNEANKENTEDASPKKVTEDSGYNSHGNRSENGTNQDSSQTSNESSYSSFESDTEEEIKRYENVPVKNREKRYTRRKTPRYSNRDQGSSFESDTEEETRAYDTVYTSSDSDHQDSRNEYEQRAKESGSKDKEQPLLPLSSKEEEFPPPPPEEELEKMRREAERQEVERREAERLAREEAEAKQKPQHQTDSIGEEEFPPPPPEEELEKMRREAERQEVERREAERQRLADEEEEKCLGDIPLLFETAEEEAKRLAREEAERQRLADEEEEKAEAKRKQEEEARKAQEEETESESQERDIDEGYESEESAEQDNKDIDAEQDNEDIDTSTDSNALEEKEEDHSAAKEQISEKVALFNKVTSNHHKPVHMLINNRFNLSAVAAGDEDTNVTRGVWISSLYGVSYQGAWNNIPKYQGRTAGLTIGMDAEFVDSSDIIGIAYSRVESHFKYNKRLGKTALNGYLLSVYGLKELPKNFTLQGVTSYSYNYIKNKTVDTSSIIGKYKNNSFNFEGLLSYKYRTKYDLHLIPNIGLKYDYSRNSNYKENDDIQNLMIQKKSNQLLTSSIGGKIVFKPIRISNDITLVPSLHGNIESHFYNKNTKVNVKANFKDQIIEEKIILSKQPKLGYNTGGNILLNKKNINVSLEYNYYTHKKYQSHQGLLKLKVNL